MHSRRIVSLAAAALLALVAAAPASANYRVGLSEQSPAMFSSPTWQSLGLKRVRYIVAWDFYKHADQNAAVASFMNGAHATGQDVLVSFSARSGCYVNGRYSRSSACRAPTPSAFKTAFLKF